MREQEETQFDYYEEEYEEVYEEEYVQEHPRLLPDAYFDNFRL